MDATTDRDAGTVTDAGRGMGTGTGTGTGRWELRQAEPADLETLVELRAQVMREDLIRVNRYDAHRIRQRLRDQYQPQHTWIVLSEGAFAGCATLRPHDGGRWLENFYLTPAVQGRGLGTAVLRALLARGDAAGVPVRLQVLQGSQARRLYERHGFTVESEDPVDVYMVRPPATPGPRA